MSMPLPLASTVISEWADAPAHLRENAYAIEQAVEHIPFEHGIRNWHMVLVTGAVIRCAGELRDGPIPDMAAVFCVNPSAWDKAQPELWARADFRQRTRYLDDRFAVQRGAAHLQRDRAMIAAGVAVGTAIAKAQEFGYLAERSHDYDDTRLSLVLGLPDDFEIAAVVAIGKRRNAQSTARWMHDRMTKSSLGRFS